MSRKRFLFSMLLLLFSVLLMAGGCGGGGGGGDGELAGPVDFEALSGTWVARDGTATASAGGETITLTLVSGGGANIDILSVSGDEEAEAEASLTASWTAPEIGTVPFHDGATGRGTIERISDNQFRYVYLNGSMTITFLSGTTARIEESGSAAISPYGTFTYSGTYYMDKQAE